MNKNMVEIERKYLVKPEFHSEIGKTASDVLLIHQGYISKNDKGSVRIRVEQSRHTKHHTAYLMSKIKVDSMTNLESVDEIAVDNAWKYIQYFSLSVVSKSRFIIYYGGKKWEVDLFSEPNNGLVLAEIELESADEEIDLPPWIDREVTGDPQYYNANM